jgi:hypothetical protein
MKKTMLRTAALAMTAFLGMAGVTQIASAQDKWTTGKIAQISVGVSPAGFVFNLEGGPSLCNSAQDDNAKNFVAITTNYMSAEAVRNHLSIVTAAKLAGRTVQVIGLNSNEPGEWGCRLAQFDLY